MSFRDLKYRLIHISPHTPSPKKAKTKNHWLFWSEGVDCILCTYKITPTHVFQIHIKFIQSKIHFIRREANIYILYNTELASLLWQSFKSIKTFCILYMKFTAIFAFFFLDIFKRKIFILLKTNMSAPLEQCPCILITPTG